MFTRELSDRIDDGVVRFPPNTEEQKTLFRSGRFIRPRPIFRIWKPPE